MSIILLLFISGAVSGQFYQYGQDAGKLKWSQFETPNYHLIFPRGTDSLARAFALRLEHFYPHTGRVLEHKHSRMPVVVHNEASFSNGVFVWAPKRLEIFTNPDPNGYNQDWLTQLALHEGRHAVQIDKLNQGFTRGLYYLTGEQGAGAMAIFLPYWYLEGDAVDAETRLSHAGRGRLPSFEMELKAQMLENKQVFSFSKAALGSYRDHIPNHYQLGYLMVRHGRRSYGDQFWIDFQNAAARRPFLLNPTYFSMRKYGLKNKASFYREAMDAYRVHWEEQALKREYTTYKEWSQSSGKHYCSYRFPYEIVPHMVLSLKTGLDQIPEFVLLGERNQEISLFRPGFLNSGRISYAGNHIIWDEWVPDLRWSNRNYSVIRSFNVSTREVKNLGRRTRYFSPAFSTQGQHIVAVEQDAFQKFRLVIMDHEGKVEQKIASPQNRFIQHPNWMAEDSALVVIVNEDQGKSLQSYSLESGQWTLLFDAGKDDISLPVVQDQYIFFHGTFSGIDNIYAFHLENKKVYQVTSERFGAFQPQISSDGKTLYYSRYTSKGYRVCTMDLSNSLWKPLAMSMNHQEQLDYKPDKEEQALLDMEVSDTLDYDIRPYRKALNLFRVHSWLPLYFNYLEPELDLNPENIPVRPGLSVISQNTLSTAVSQLGYEYREGNHFFHSGIQFNGRYPVLNFYFDYGGQADVLFRAEGDSLLSVPKGLGFRAQSYIPFRLNTGKYLSLIQPRIDYSYQRDVQYDQSAMKYKIGAHYLKYSLYATTYLRQGQRDILPRLGYLLSTSYYHAPLSPLFGAVAMGGLTAYLPSPLKHHSFRISGYFQKQYPRDMSRPVFINLMNGPRGLHGIFGEELTRFSVDYVFPLLYPDLELGGLVYLQRIRAALWTDYMQGRNVIVYEPEPHYKDKAFQTLGMDLIADLNVFRISFPISAGARFIYDPAMQDLRVEALWAIDID